MSAYSRVQESRGMESFALDPFGVRVYPNVIEIWDTDNNRRVVAMLPEHWAAIVQFVGIKGIEVAGS